MGEYTDKDMVKSLVRAIELLAEENKELRKEIESLRTIPAMRFDSTSLGLPPVTDGEDEDVKMPHNRRNKPLYSMKEICEMNGVKYEDGDINEA